MEGYAEVLSRDEQGGALLREVAKLEKFENNTIETFGEDLHGIFNNWVQLWLLLQLRAPAER